MARNAKNGIWGKKGLFGTSGDDELSTVGAKTTLKGRAGNDTLEGGPRDDKLHGGRGEDVLEGLGGRDKLWGGRQDDFLDGGNGNDMLRGGRGEDRLEGGNGRDKLWGGRHDDILDGGSGNDMLRGGRGEDRLEGGDGRDKLWGGRQSDFLEGGAGNDVMRGGRGNDELLSISWGGEPEIAQQVAAGVRKVEPNEPLRDNDVMVGGRGADVFSFRWLIDAKDEILDKHRDANGNVDYRAVAGENGAPHDHWVEHIGHDVVRDFDARRDELVFEGHTVRLESATMIDADRDGREDDTLLTFYSEQGGAGAHQGDALGTVTLIDAEIAADDVAINRNVFYGVEDPYSAVG